MTIQTICIAKPTKDVLKIYPLYKTFFPRFYKTLAEFHPIKVLDLPDIWVRDFLPVQNIKTGDLSRFRFSPRYANYTTKFTERINNSVKDLFPVKEYALCLDGGNVGRGPEETVFCLESRRIFRKSAPKEQGMAEDILKSALGAKHIVWLPREIGDKIGHIDGFMQFMGNTLFVSDERFDPYLEQLLRKRLAHLRKLYQNLKVCFLPCVPDYEDKSALSARGIYVNFLETSQAIFVPQYNLPQDKEVLAIIKAVTDKPIVGVDCSEIARYGGAVHCLTKEYEEKI